MTRLRTLAAPVAIAAALAAAGCGGDDDKDKTTSSSASTPAATTSTPATSTPTTTDDTSSDSGDGKVSAEELQKAAQALATKWQAKAQELTSKARLEPPGGQEGRQPVHRRLLQGLRRAPGEGEELRRPRAGPQRHRAAARRAEVGLRAGQAAARPDPGLIVPRAPGNPRAPDPAGRYAAAGTCSSSSAGAAIAKRGSARCAGPARTICTSWMRRSAKPASQ